MSIQASVNSAIQSIGIANAVNQKAKEDNANNAAQLEAQKASLQQQADILAEMRKKANKNLTSVRNAKRETQSQAQRVMDTARHKNLLGAPGAGSADFKQASNAYGGAQAKYEAALKERRDIIKKQTEVGKKLDDLDKGDKK